MHPALAFGEVLADPSLKSRAPESEQDVRRGSPAQRKPELVSRTPIYGQEPEVDKWPAWKVSVFLISFCGAFWVGVYFLVQSLMHAFR